MDEEHVVVEAIPTSMHTAQLSEIVLSETERTKTVFEPLHVDNPKDKTKQLKGKFIFYKPTVATHNDLSKLSKRDIKSNEYIELSFNTEEIYNLYQGLRNCFLITSNRYSPVKKTRYISTVSDSSVIRVLREKPQIVQALAQQDMDVLSAVMHIAELQKVKTKIEQNIENSDEQFWQDLFREHSWVLSQLFALPYMLFQNQPYVGGKGISGTAGKFPDYLFKNGITENVAIIEIKTPITELLYDSSYRSGVYSVHKDLSGAVSQVLIQRDNLYKHYASLRMDSSVIFESDNIECIVIAGNVSKLDSAEKRKSFVSFRNELRNVRVIGFDELLLKIQMMLTLLSGETSE